MPAISWALTTTSGCLSGLGRTNKPERKMMLCFRPTLRIPSSGVIG